MLCRLPAVVGQTQFSLLSLYITLLTHCDVNRLTLIVALFCFFFLSGSIRFTADSSDGQLFPNQLLYLLTPVQEQNIQYRADISGFLDVKCCGFYNSTLSDVERYRGMKLTGIIWDFLFPFGQMESLTQEENVVAQKLKRRLVRKRCHSIRAALRISKRK